MNASKLTRHGVLATLVVAGLIGASAQADPAPAGSVQRELSIEQAVALSLKNSPRLRTGRQELVRGIDLQVQAAWLKLQETAEKIQIARSAVVQATEQVRLERERYEAQQNTSTDVLDAQTRLTQARVTTDSAEIEHRISLAALDMAIGRLPWTGTHHRAAAGSPAVQELQ